jgi:DNA-binding MarR family transcriptional regulator
MSATQDLFFAQQVLASLFSVTNKLQMRGDKYLQDLTLRQMLAVQAVAHTPDGKATINHIARKLSVTKQSAKQLVDAMGKKGCLSVAPSERDKRAVDITVTTEGQQVFRACSERTDVFMADIFRDFTTGDLETLCTLLEKLYRFDGAKQDGIQQHIDDHASKGDDVLEYHQNFTKRRTGNNE